LFLQEYFHPHNPGKGFAATIDATNASSHHEHLTPCAYENVTFLLIEQLKTHSRTPQKEYAGAPSTARCMEDHAEQGQAVDPSESSIDIAQETFLGSSHVISTGTIHTIFLVDKNISPIKIENIRGITIFFNYYI